MAEELERLLVRVDANAAYFESQMRKINAALYGSQRETRKTLDRMNRDMDRRGADMAATLRQHLMSVAPVLAASFSAAAVIRYADGWSAARNQLASAGVAAADLATRQEQLTDVASRSLSSAEGTFKLYSRLTLATERYGTSAADVLRITELVNKSFVSSGASTGEAASGILQLSQALASGVLQGDELRSLRENAPQIAQAIAAAMGVSIGELKKLGAEGKITADVVTKAILSAGDQIEARFATMTPTVGQAFTVLNNEIGRFVGQADSGLSATQRMAEGIIALSQNLDTVALVVGAVTAVMGGRFVLAMTAGSGAMIANGVAAVRLAAFQTAMTASMTGTTTATLVATGAMRSFSAALAANPIGAAILATAALAAGVAFLSNKYGEANVLQRELKTTSDASSKALDAYRDAATKAATATGENAKQARANVEAMRAEALAALRSAEALRVRRLQLLADRKVAAEEAVARFGRSSGGGKGAIEAAGGDLARAQSQLRVAQAAYDAAAAETTKQEAAFRELDEEIRNPRLAPAVIPTAPPARSGAGSAASGPSPEDLERQRQLLDLQAEIERLRAEGRDAEADARQDQLDVLELTKRYEEAGFENASKKAADQVAFLASARDEARAREEAAREAEAEARALDLMRQFTLDMLDVQERLALTDRDALEVRRKILRVRQAERRAALEAAAADATAAEAERAAARTALEGLGGLEAGEDRELESSRAGARDAQGIIADLRVYDEAVERAREAYEELAAMREANRISEQEAALAIAQVDTQLREQRLAGARSMFDALATLQNSSNKKIAAIGKAAAITQATIDGVLAVQKALASAPPPFNFIQAAIVGAVAAANVAQIAGMADGGLVKGKGGPREDKELRRLSPGEFVVNAAATAQNRALLEQINRGARIPALAEGGLVRQVNAAASQVAALRPREPGSPVVFAPTIDARGADLGVERRLQAQLDQFSRDLPNLINGVRDRREKYRLGGRRP